MKDFCVEVRQVRSSPAQAGSTGGKGGARGDAERALPSLLPLERVSGGRGARHSVSMCGVLAHRHCAEKIAEA